MDWSHFTPHGFCLAWDPALIWVEAAADALIALAYFSIPAALLVFLRRRQDLAFKPIFGLFAAFILACGTTHVMGALTLWLPAYWTDAAIKSLTAALSVATAVILWPLLPKALALPSPAALREANAALAREIERRDAVAALLRESEARLRQAQKMEAVGQLTGGIAHDFNNMLTVVMGSLEMLPKLVTLDARATRLTDHALQSAQRSARLTAQLLSFSRRSMLEPVALHPADIVEGIRELLARSLGDAIALDIIPPAPGQWPLLADRNQTQAAVLNIVINARDAISGSGGAPLSLAPHGHVRISFANRTLGEAEAERLSPDPAAPGDYVVIAIADDGAGMPDAVRARVFEPFFTTKPAGTGTGLGLSQTYGFATQSGGTVQIASREGGGTTVEIWLPRSPHAPAAAGEPDLPAMAGSRAG
jgi:signal transduction histidine kinase